MGPALILDKSTIQSLSFEELIVLRRYFNVSIVPVIALEILADLKKPHKDRPPEDVVRKLADKLMPSVSLVTVDYRTLLAGSLEGHHIDMSFRPVIGQGREVEDEDGEKGYVRHMSDEEQAIQRWRDGQFTEAEEILAGKWREMAQTLDLESLKALMAPQLDRTQMPTDATSLKQQIESLLTAAHESSDLIRLSLALGGFDRPLVNRVWLRWMGAGRPPLLQFAPYAHYFVRVNYIFFYALAAGLVGTRGTNAIDLEYLYYLPFCEVFSSGDKFHQYLAPILLKERQFFVNKDDLKADLSRLNSTWKALTREQQDDNIRRYAFQPMDEESLVYRIRKHCWPGWHPKETKPVEKLSEEEERNLVEQINRYDSLPDRGVSMSEDESDFLIVSSWVRRLDPCICGSGRPFGECHGSVLREDEWKK